MFQLQSPCLPTGNSMYSLHLQEAIIGTVEDNLKKKQVQSKTPATHEIRAAQRQNLTKKRVRDCT